MKTTSLLTLSVFFLSLSFSVAQAATITVNTTSDETTNDGDCSLREAIISANIDGVRDACQAGSGTDTINIPAGTYVLSLFGTGDDSSTSGDLDIRKSVVLVGDGPGLTIIDGGDANGDGLLDSSGQVADRVFDVSLPDNTSASTVTFRNLTIQNGFTAASGAGINVQSSAGVVVIDNCLIQKNSASSFGGGLSVGVTATTVTMTKSFVRDNKSAAGGAGLRSIAASLTIDGSSFIRNSSTGGGEGGAFLISNGSNVITNSTINQNTTTNRGGAFSLSAPVQLTNVTMTENTATTGSPGAFMNGANGRLTLKNTILSNVTDIFSQQDCTNNGGVIISEGHNLENGNSCGFNSTPGDGDLIDTNPQLGGLQDIGGGLLGQIPANNSPAIDAGDNNGCPTNDQRGFLRSLGGVCDIGAIELGCGDGIVSKAEVCDDANSVNTDACLNSCVLATCGDSVVHDGVEACDDGNQVNDDSCTNACALATCGDGLTQAPETCDDANQDNTDNCLNTCLIPSCGDGFVHSGVEVCDDGNEVNGDGCSSVCAVEAPADAAGAADDEGGIIPAGGGTAAPQQGGGGGCSLMRGN